MGETRILAMVVVCALAPRVEGQTRFSATLHCETTGPGHSVELGDRSGHRFALGQSKCRYTTPLEIAGIAIREELATSFNEYDGQETRHQGFVMGFMANGDRYYMRTAAILVTKDGKSQGGEGKWVFTGGSGKLAGLSGGGILKGKRMPDGRIPWTVEGEYKLAR